MLRGDRYLLRGDRCSARSRRQARALHLLEDNHQKVLANLLRLILGELLLLGLPDTTLSNVPIGLDDSAPRLC